MNGFEGERRKNIIDLISILSSKDISEKEEENQRM